jgi:hypothetical protein
MSLRDAAGGRQPAPASPRLGRRPHPRSVAFLSGDRGSTRIELRPGRAIGWTENPIPSPSALAPRNSASRGQFVS